jgi:hypothetical protein
LISDRRYVWPLAEDRCVARGPARPRARTPLLLETIRGAPLVLATSQSRIKRAITRCGVHADSHGEGQILIILPHCALRDDPHFAIARRRFAKIEEYDRKTIGIYCARLTVLRGVNRARRCVNARTRCFRCCLDSGVVRLGNGPTAGIEPRDKNAQRGKDARRASSRRARVTHVHAPAERESPRLVEVLPYEVHGIRRRGWRFVAVGPLDSREAVTRRARSHRSRRLGGYRGPPKKTCRHPKLRVRSFPRSSGSRPSLDHLVLLGGETSARIVGHRAHAAATERARNTSTKGAVGVSSIRHADGFRGYERSAH